MLFRSLDSMFGWQSSQDFELVMKSASAVPGVAAATYLNYVVRKVIDTGIIEISHLTFYVSVLSLPAHFGTGWIQPSLSKLHRFIKANAALWPTIRDF